MVTDSEEKPVAINWTPGDKIKVFSDGQAAEFTSINETPTRVARFRGYVSFVTGADDGAEIAYVWGLYPYREDAVYTEPETGVSRTAVITTTLPAAQTGKAGTFDDGYALTIGRSESLSIPFKTVYTLMRFTVSRDDIKSVSFKGNNSEAIAGRVSIGMDDTATPVAPIVRSIVEPETEITLRMADGSCFEKGKFYYIVLLPTTFNDGFTFTVTRSDGMVGDFSINGNVTLSRNKFSGVSNLDTRVSSWTVAKPGSNEIWYTTTDGKALVLSGISPAPTRGNVSRDASSILENIAPEDNDGIGILRFASAVSTIDPGTFANLTTLSSVTLPETLETIGNEAFSGCSSLESITLTSVTPPTIGTNAFSNTNDCPIYVPTGTADEYVAESGWTGYEDRIRQMPPKVIKSFSYSSDYPMAHTSKMQLYFTYDEEERLSSILESSGGSLLSYQYSGSTMTSSEAPNTIINIDGNGRFSSVDQSADGDGIYNLNYDAEGRYISLGDAVIYNWQGSDLASITYGEELPIQTHFAPSEYLAPVSGVDMNLLIRFMSNAVGLDMVGEEGALMIFPSLLGKRSEHALSILFEDYQTPSSEYTYLGWFGEYGGEYKGNDGEWHAITPSVIFNWTEGTGTFEIRCSNSPYSLKSGEWTWEADGDGSVTQAIWPLISTNATLSANMVVSPIDRNGDGRIDDNEVEMKVQDVVATPNASTTEYTVNFGFGY